MSTTTQRLPRGGESPHTLHFHTHRFQFGSVPSGCRRWFRGTSRKFMPLCWTFCPPRPETLILESCSSTCIRRRGQPRSRTNGSASCSVAGRPAAWAFDLHFGVAAARTAQAPGCHDFVCGLVDMLWRAQPVQLACPPPLRSLNLSQAPEFREQSPRLRGRDAWLLREAG